VHVEKICVRCLHANDMKSVIHHSFEDLYDRLKAHLEDMEQEEDERRLKHTLKMWMTMKNCMKCLSLQA
jgi:hypothetical protein